jgi:hypothetical protein
VLFRCRQMLQAEKHPLHTPAPRHCRASWSRDHIQPDYGLFPPADLRYCLRRIEVGFGEVCHCHSSSHCSMAHSPSPAIMWALAPGMCRRVYLILTSLVSTHIS